MPTTTTLKNGAVCIVSHCTARDAGPLVEYSRHFFEHAPQVATSPGEFRRTAAEQRAMVRERLGHPRKLLVKATIDGRIIGLAGFECGHRRKLAHHGELGMGVAPEVRGLGVGRALLLAVLEWAVANPAIEKVDLGVYPTNRAAVALYRSCGFRTECRRRRFFKHPDGSYSDVLLMAVYVKPGVAPSGFLTFPLPSLAPPARRSPRRRARALSS